jgi:cytochrome b6-f complex iron-sulfur subunit
MMSNDQSHLPSHFFYATDRRRFLRYFIGGGAGAVALGLLRSQPSLGVQATLEDLCSAFPANSRCETYLPGVQALDAQGNPIAVNSFLSTTKTGEPVAVRGDSHPDLRYLVITDGPAIASYGIKPVCTHLGCTVAWKTDQQQFVCPCHGSKYDSQGRVAHGPARRALPLITVIVKQNQVRLVDRAPAIDPR